MRLSRLLIASLLAALTAAVCAVPAGAWTGDQVAAYAAGAERSWAALTASDGAVTDKLEPAEGGFNYGTLMLADAQLRTAAHTGEPALKTAAVAQILGTVNRTAPAAPNDPFNVLAIATLLSDGRAGRLPADAWARIREPLEAMSARIAPYREGSFASPGRYDNWKLVWSAGAIGLAHAGVRGQPGSITHDPAALRAEVTRIVSTLMPAGAGPLTRTPYGPGRVLSDPPQQPNAYHIFSVMLLERIYRTDPAVFNEAALNVREQAGRYALALMAPDGQLTHQGRSMQQSWVLAAAADLGALRAGAGGPHASAWRTFAERAMTRLARVHGTFADGTIPVVPGLRRTQNTSITDGYSSMSQYNGLTVFLLEHAAAHWPEHVSAGSLPADRDHLVDDLAGSGLIWGRAGNIWWAVQGRKTRADTRYDQGVAAVKVRVAGEWRDRLASTPRITTPAPGWRLRTPRGIAHLQLTHAAGTGARAVLTGRWVLASGTYRPARWEVRVDGRALHVTAEPLRRGESLTAAVWVRPAAARGAVASSGRAASTERCVTSASGGACARTLSWDRPGRPRLTLGL